MTTIYIGNDHTVSVTGLADGAGTIITGATVQCSLLKKLDRTVVGGGVTFPLAMPEGAAGEYSATIDKSVGVVAGEKYYISITAVQGSIDAQWDLDASCNYRTK